jgi:endogenous inhibitor of DNA gyrase (YacG/DUF329 family)
MEYFMGLFRRAKDVCPKCGKKKQVDIGEKYPRVKKWFLTRSDCGSKFIGKIEPAWWICFREDNSRLRCRKIGQGKWVAGRRKRRKMFTSHYRARQGPRL